MPKNFDTLVPNPLGQSRTPLPGPAPSELIQRGRRERREGNHSQALQLLRMAQRSSPYNPALKAEIADTLRRLGRLAEAEAVLNSILARSPNHLAALAGLARCSKTAGDHDLALKRFAVAAAYAGMEPGPYQGLAEAQLQVNLVAEAAASYSLMLERAPKSTAAMTGLAKCARRNGDRISALMHIQSACAEAPDNLAFRVQLVDDLRELDRLEEAEAELTAVLARDPKNVSALLAAARLARRQNQPGRLLSLYEQVRELDPDDARAAVGLIAANRDFGDIERARALIRELLHRTPDHVQAHIELGMLERLCGDHSAALQAFSTAQQIEPGRTDVTLHMARECLSLGERTKGEALIAAAIADDPSSAQASLLSAQKAVMIDDHLAALVIVKDCLARGLRNVGLLTTAAEALGRLGRLAEAMTMLDLARHAQGNQLDVTVKRLVLMRQMGLWGEALEIGREADAATPSAFAIKQQLFYLHLLIGTQDDVDRSLATLTPATRTERAQCATLHGMAAEERGDLASAIVHYEKAVEEFPTGPEPYRLLARVHVLLFNFDLGVNSLRQYAALTRSKNKLRKRSVNWSQTHIGQIVNECLLDNDACEAMRGVLHLAPSKREEASCEFVSHFADSTLAALVLVDVFWSVDAFDQRLSSKYAPRSSAIPHRIVQFWDSGDPPADISVLMGTWLVQNPAFEYIKFDEESAEQFLRKHHPPEMLQAYRRALEPAKKADFFRLAYLFVHGGIYVDADDRCRTSLLPLLPAHADLVLYREDAGTLGNNFIAASPNHPVIGAALHQAVVAINRGDDELLWLATGPGLITRAFAQQVSSAADRKAFLSAIKIWNRRAIYQCVAMHCVTAHKGTKSYWGNAAFQQSNSGVRKMKILARVEGSNLLQTEAIGLNPEAPQWVASPEL